MMRPEANARWRLCSSVKPLTTRDDIREKSFVRHNVVDPAQAILQLLRIQVVDPCAPSPDPFATMRELFGSINLDRHFTPCAHQRVFRSAPGASLDPFRGIENECAESSRLNTLAPADS